MDQLMACFKEYFPQFEFIDLSTVATIESLYQQKKEDELRRVMIKVFNTALSTSSILKYNDALRVAYLLSEKPVRSNTDNDEQ